MVSVGQKEKLLLAERAPLACKARQSVARTTNKEARACATCRVSEAGGSRAHFSRREKCASFRVTNAHHKIRLIIWILIWSFMR